MSVAEAARRAGCSFATAWQVVQAAQFDSTEMQKLLIRFFLPMAICSPSRVA